MKLAGRGRDAASPLGEDWHRELYGEVGGSRSRRRSRPRDSLTRAEAELLQELASHPREILSRERLRHAVTHRGRNRFDESVEPFDRSIDMLVARLRRKIEPDAKAPQFLLTVPGVGYKLIARPISDAERSQAKPGEPERRQITALCCSLVGAMEFALGFDPEDLSRISRSFHDAAAAAVTRLGGTIAYVTPDQILAIFGYPGAHEDGAERAVKAGLDALANVGEIISPRGDALRSRVGIATGLALASPTEIVGGPSAIATAVCAVAPPDAVLVTASAHRRLSSAFACDKLEEYPLAGLNVSVTACRVTAKREVKSRFRATRSKKVVQLVGRARELQELIALWQRAKGGRGQVALISGEPGIGKSHLCEFLLEQLTEQRHLTLRYQCSPHHVNSPFYPVISHLEHAMGFEPSDTAEIKLKKQRVCSTGRRSHARRCLFVCPALVRSDTRAGVIARADAAAAEGSHDRRHDPTPARRITQATSSYRPRRRALDRFQHKRIGWPDHFIAQDRSHPSAHRIQTEIHPAMARRQSCDGAAPRATGTRAKPRHHPSGNRRQKTAPRG